MRLARAVLPHIARQGKRRGPPLIMSYLPATCGQRSTTGVDGGEMQRLTMLSLLVLLTLCPHAVRANPEYLERLNLEEATRAFLDQPSPSTGQAFSDCLVAFRYEFSPEMAELVQQNFAIFEPYIVAAALARGRADLRLHEALLSNGSPAAIQSVCRDLRGRIHVPSWLLSADCEEFRDAQRRREAMMACGEVLLIVETLSDYGDSSALPRIAAIRDSLSSAPCESLWTRTFQEAPSWYVHMATERIADPQRAAVLLAKGDRGVRVTRSANDVVSCNLEASRDWRRVKHTVSTDELDFQQLLDLLASSSRTTACTGKVHGWIDLTLRFTDGVIAHLRCNPPCDVVRYSDNARFTSPSTHLQSLALANLMGTLADELW
jgi:hypothetical protein